MSNKKRTPGRHIQSVVLTKDIYGTNKDGKTVLKHKKGDRRQIKHWFAGQ